MHILNKREPKFTIPAEAEYLYNQVFGDLVCSQCKQIIVPDSGESDNHWNIQRIQHLIAAHLCNGVKFKYDFNDPRTLKEQLEVQKKLGGLF